ncbi:hypothetical protein B0H11DRAFT_1235670 [Mycena galericulata]|nr:hypothetical protein B0H11DRAFT_1235670 [Mycena galericulata]
MSYPPPITPQASQSGAPSHATFDFGSLCLPTSGPQITSPASAATPSTDPKSLAGMCPGIALPGSASQPLGSGGTSGVQPTVPTPPGASSTCMPPPTLLPPQSTQGPPKEILVKETNRATEASIPPSQSSQVGEEAAVPSPKTRQSKKSKEKVAEVAPPISQGDAVPAPPNKTQKSKKAKAKAAPSGEGVPAPPAASRSRKRANDDSAEENPVPAKKQRQTFAEGFPEVASHTTVLRFDPPQANDGDRAQQPPARQRNIPLQPPVASTSQLVVQQDATQQPAPQQTAVQVQAVHYPGQPKALPQFLFQRPSPGQPNMHPPVAEHAISSGLGNVVLQPGGHLVYGPDNLPIEHIPTACYSIALLEGARLEQARQMEGRAFFGNEMYDPTTGEPWVIRIQCFAARPAARPAFPPSVHGSFPALQVPITYADNQQPEDPAAFYQMNAGPSSQAAYAYSEEDPAAFYQTDAGPSSQIVYAEPQVLWPSTSRTPGPRGRPPTRTTRKYRVPPSSTRRTVGLCFPKTRCSRQLLRSRSCRRRRKSTRHRCRYRLTTNTCSTTTSSRTAASTSRNRPRPRRTDHWPNRLCHSPTSNRMI